MAIVPFELYDKPWYLACLIVTAVIQAYLTAAPIYGFSSILVIFKRKHYYQQLCLANHTSINQTDGSSSVNLETCIGQDKALNLMFVIGIVFHCTVKFPAGRIVDKIGAQLCQYIGCVFIIIFSSCLAYSSQGKEYLVIIAFIFLALGSSFLMLTCHQVVNIMFRKNKPFFLCLLSGAVDSSTAVFVVFLSAFDKGYSLPQISFAFGSITVIFVILTTAFLYPSIDESKTVIDADVKRLFKEAETVEENDFAKFSHDLSASYHGGVTSSFNAYKKSIQKNLLEMTAEERFNDFSLSISRSMGFSYDASDFDSSTECAEELPFAKRGPYGIIKENVVGYGSDEYGANTLNESIGMTTQERAPLIDKSKKLFKSSTDESLWHHVFSKLNFLMIFCFSITQIRILYFIGNLDKYFDNITDKETGTKYIKYFGLSQFIGIFVGPLAALLFIRKAKEGLKTEEELRVENLRKLILPGIAFISSVLLLTGLQLFEKLYLSIPLFLCYLSSNGLMWCFAANFYGLIFPAQHFCSMFGFLMVISGCLSFLQSPILLMEQYVFFGHQLWTNVIFLALVTLSYMVPFYLWYLAKELEKKVRSKDADKAVEV